MRASESSSWAWLQRVGRLTAICLADSGWPVPAMVRTFDFSRSPLYVDGEKLVLVARATSSRNPKASDPRWTFVSWETSLSVRWLHALIRASILRRTGRSLFVWSPLVAARVEKHLCRRKLPTRERRPSSGPVGSTFEHPREIPGWSCQ